MPKNNSLQKKISSGMKPTPAAAHRSSLRSVSLEWMYSQRLRGFQVDSTSCVFVVHSVNTTRKKWDNEIQSGSGSYPKKEMGSARARHQARFRWHHFINTNFSGIFFGAWRRFWLYFIPFLWRSHPSVWSDFNLLKPNPRIPPHHKWHPLTRERWYLK